MLLEFVWLPNLRTLWLASFRLVDENSIPRILQVFSSLEHLVLILQSLNENENESQSEGVQVESLCFSIPSLKWFELCSDEQEFNVVVKAENLVNFVCDLEGLHKVTLDALNLKSLTVATCEITQFVREHYEGVFLFACLALYVSSMTIPTSRNLVKLELIPDYCPDFRRSCISHVLLKLFESAYLQ
ncbi:hypothetical protein GmHk_08G024201 [Glycine max]|nr:hypothetical protein GmHk_08G024201 [Glycine max]